MCVCAFHHICVCSTNIHIYTYAGLCQCAHSHALAFANSDISAVAPSLRGLCSTKTWDSFCDSVTVPSHQESCRRPIDISTKSRTKSPRIKHHDFRWLGLNLLLVESSPSTTSRSYTKEVSKGMEFTTQLFAAGSAELPVLWSVFNYAIWPSHKPNVPQPGLLYFRACAPAQLHDCECRSSRAL